jgi:hypothetical protein
MQRQTLPLRPDDNRPQEDSILMDASNPEDISNLAHQLWIERGSPVGSPDEDWLQAEKILQETSLQAAG